MNAYGLLEILIVGLIVALSAWSVLRPWMRKRSAAVTQSGCSSKSSACGGCSGGGCGSSSKEQPIRFHH